MKCESALSTFFNNKNENEIMMIERRAQDLMQIPEQFFAAIFSTIFYVSFIFANLQLFETGMKQQAVDENACF